MKNKSNTEVAPVQAGGTQRAGLPVQAGYSPDNPALRKFKVTLTHSLLPTIHGGVWATDKEHAKGMLVLNEHRAATIIEVGTNQAIFWDDDFHRFIGPPPPAMAPVQVTRAQLEALPALLATLKACDEEMADDPRWELSDIRRRVKATIAQAERGEV